MTDRRGESRRRLSPCLLRWRWLSLCWLVACLFSMARAQEIRTCLLLPFENRSGNPSLDWIGESFYQFAAASIPPSLVTVLARDQRQQALALAGIPPGSILSHASALRVADRIDANWLLVGWFDSDGTNIEAHADLFALPAQRLETLPVRSGPLRDLQALQAQLAGDIVHAMNPEDPGTAATLPPPLPLNAYENYVRGLAASNSALRLHDLNAAARLAPTDARVQFALGDAYLQAHNDSQARVWLVRVPHDAPEYPQARFDAGLAAYRLGSFTSAAADFQALAASWPLPEVLNNWAIARTRAGGAAARAAALDSLDTLRRAAAQEPSDKEIASNLAWLAALAHGLHAPDHLPIMKLTFPEQDFRQLESTVAQFDQAKRDALPVPAQVAADLAAAGCWLQAGAWDAAAENDRHALTLLGDPPSNPAQAVTAHTGLAQSLWRQNQVSAANLELDRALGLDPHNSATLKLRKQIEAAAHE